MFIDRWETSGTQIKRKLNGFFDYQNKPDRIISQMVDKTNGIWALDSNTKGYWHLDENSGTNVYDSSYYNHTGSITGASWTQGRFGRSCLYFDGDDHVAWSDTADHRPDYITMEAWIRPESGAFGAGAHNIINNFHFAAGYYGYELALYYGKLRIAVGLSAGGNLSFTEPTISMKAGTWYHVAGTIGPTQSKLYINDVCVATSAYAASTIRYHATKPGLKLGRMENPGEYWYGKIDCARILDEVWADFN